MTDATTTPEPPAADDVKIEDVGPALKRLTITIQPDTIAEKLEESIGALSTEAAMPGFRRGKAPRRLLEKRFGSSVRDETKNRLIADAYARAVESHGIQPVGEPEPTEPPENLKIEAGKPLSFAVDVEVVPEFELPPLEGIEIKKPLLEITKEHIDERLHRQQLRLGDAKRIDGDFEQGDRLVGQVTVTKAGEEKPLFENEQAAFVCPGKAEGGRGVVLGLMVEGLAAMLDGKRVGDTLTIETVGPEVHEREDIRGAQLTITFRISAAERPIPATVEKLVETFGVGSEENLREQMRLALQHQRDQEQANAMREQVYDHLTKTVDLAMPEKLSAMQAARTLEGHRMELLESGLTPDEVESRLADMRGDSVAEARDRLKLFFVLRRLGEHFKVEVSEQEVNGRIATMAAMHGQRPDQLRAELARTGRLQEVARVVFQQKAADRVIANAKIQEIPADKWNELMSGGKAPAKKKTTKKKTTTKKKK